MPFDPDLLEPVRALPGIESLYSVRRVTIDSPRRGSGEAEPTEVTALDTDRSGFAGYRFLGAQKGENDRVWPAFQGDAAVLISEPLAFHRELSVGDTVTLETDRGAVPLPIAAVYRDYSSDRGEVLLKRFVSDPELVGEINPSCRVRVVHTDCVVINKHRAVRLEVSTYMPGRPEGIISVNDMPMPIIMISTTIIARIVSTMLAI